MELGESLEDTAKREVQEETGLAITDLQLLGVFLVRIVTLKFRMGTNYTPLQQSSIQGMCLVI